MICVLSILGYAITYLYFLRKIREHTEVSSLFAINFIKVYRSYLYIRKTEGKQPGVLFYIHFISIIITLILGYIYEGESINLIGG
jgi:hypothetical protein